MRIENFCSVATGFEEAFHELGDLSVSFDEEYQDAGPSATEATPEQAGGLEKKDFFQARDEFGAVGLVDAVFKSRGEGVSGARSERRDEQRGPLDVEDCVCTRVGGGEGRAGFLSWQEEIRHDDSDFEMIGQIETHGVGAAGGIGGTGNDRAKDAGSGIVRVTFKTGCCIENTIIGPVEAEERIGDEDAGGEGGRAGSEAFGEGSLGNNFEFDGWKGQPEICGNLLCGLPDEVICACGDEVRIAALDANREVVCHAKAAVEIETDREAEGVKAGAEVCAGSGDADAPPTSHERYSSSCVCREGRCDSRGRWYRSIAQGQGRGGLLRR